MGLGWPCGREPPWWVHEAAGMCVLPQALHARCSSSVNSTSTPHELPRRPPPWQPAQGHGGAQRRQAGAARFWSGGRDSTGGCLLLLPSVPLPLSAGPAGTARGSRAARRACFPACRLALLPPPYLPNPPTPIQPNPPTHSNPTPSPLHSRPTARPWCRPPSTWPTATGTRS